MKDIERYLAAFNEMSHKLLNSEPSNNKLIKLIRILKLSVENLVIALYLLHKFRSNQVVDIDSTDNKLVAKTIVVLLILSNKIFNDQSYTFKTWLNLIEISKIPNIDLKILKQMEVWFLTCLDYKLDYRNLVMDQKFWETLSKLNRNNYFKNWLVMSSRFSTPATSPLLTPVHTPQSSPLHNYTHSAHGMKYNFNFNYIKSSATKRTKPNPVYITPNDFSYEFIPPLHLHN